VFPDVAQHDRAGIDVVDRDVEEALDLLRMEMFATTLALIGTLAELGRRSCRA
jgi:hypothetical protein